jgi:hypothetical protein
MKAVSIRQPWGFAILHLGKDIENRTWNTRIRGRVLIHVGKQRDLRHNLLIRNDPRFDNFHYDSKETSELAKRGGIIGSVEIIDCFHSSDPKVKDNVWNDRAGYCWLLANPIALPFRELKGQQMFFEVPDE